jgi:hypothetical protein
MIMRERIAIKINATVRMIWHHRAGLVPIAAQIEMLIDVNKK